MPNVAVDDIDLALLGALQADARAPIAELSRAAGVSRATAYARMAQLRKAGVIDRFTVSVNPYRVGLSVAAVLLLTTDTWTKGRPSHRLSTKCPKSSSPQTWPASST